jgi:hypothetical protein
METKRIVNIHKKADKGKCSNYKGISLLSSAYEIYTTVTRSNALGGLVVVCLPLDPRFTGSNPAEDDGFFRSTTSFGEEVKPSVPCCRFTAYKRNLRA